MKKLLIITFMIVANSLFAQYGQPQITYDPTQAGNMSSQLTASSKQLAETQKTLNYMRQTQEALNKVSGFVQGLDEAEGVISNYKEALGYANRIPTKLSKYSDVNARKSVTKSVVSSINAINSSLQLVQRLMSDGSSKMNDYERTQLIKEEYTKSKLMKNKLKKLAN